MYLYADTLLHKARFHRFGIGLSRIDAQNSRRRFVVRFQQQPRLFHAELCQVQFCQPTRMAIPQRVVFRLCLAVRLRQLVGMTRNGSQQSVDIIHGARVCAAQRTRQSNAFIDRRRIGNAIHPDHLIHCHAQDIQHARIDLFQTNLGVMREIKIAHCLVLQHAADQGGCQCCIAFGKTRRIFLQRRCAPCVIFSNGKQSPCRCLAGGGILTHAVPPLASQQPRTVPGSIA